MRQRRILPATLAAAVLLLGAGGSRVKLVDRWKDPQFGSGRFEKMIVVGITDDQQARRAFEDQFVSHLRGRYLEAVTSYSLVPDLTTIDDPQAVIEAIEEQQVDGAITVRLVPLKGRDMADWTNEWRAAIDSQQRLRELIDAALPLPERASGKYGVEVGLWATAERRLVWAARTDAEKLTRLSKSRADFVQSVMSALSWDGLLPR